MDIRAFRQDGSTVQGDVEHIAKELGLSEGAVRKALNGDTVLKGIVLVQVQSEKKTKAKK